jgi:hypothetical protein
VRDLADVEQPVLARQQVDERTEVEDLGDRAFVDLADLDLGRDLLDPLLGVLGLVGIDEAMVIVPSSPMSIVQPVSSVSARMVEPPLPITSRIFSGLIFMV